MAHYQETKHMYFCEYQCMKNKAQQLNIRKLGIYWVKCRNCVHKWCDGHKIGWGDTTRVWVDYSLFLKDKIRWLADCGAQTDLILATTKTVSDWVRLTQKIGFPKNSAEKRSLHKALIVTDKNCAGHRIECTTNQDVYGICCIGSKTLQDLLMLSRISPQIRITYRIVCTASVHSRRLKSTHWWNICTVCAKQEFSW